MSDNGEHADPQQIHREIQQTRAQMARTLDVLRREATGEEAKQNAKGVAREGAKRGWHAFAGFVERHPVPFAMLGLGAIGALLLFARAVHHLRR